MAPERMDCLDRRILDIIQSGFPLAPRPYAEVGRQVGLTEAETLARVRRLKQMGVIRRIGASFNSRGLGWTSTLCAASVPEDKLEAFIKEVNRHPEVTHNYLRKHECNVWFTLIAENVERVEAILRSVEDATGIPVLNLPAEKLFKIKVDFNMAGA
ncbi:MAG: siroheme decarboxylase [Desulfovibrionales bacterium]|nr:siroheme decarboxylase [Desulfovibrionales bacterium]